MPLDINRIFAPHERVLTAASQRLELLAANLANADTPNYKARDIDFRSVLADAESRDGSTRLVATTQGHIQGATGAGARADVKYRVPDQPSMDGNTVEAEKESAAIAETATRYQASLTFLDQRIRGLRLAITGNR